MPSKKASKTRKDGKTDKRFKGNKGGRPRVVIDYDTLQGLCKIFCTGEESAAILGMDYDTLDRRIREDTSFEGFTDYYKTHSSSGKMSLRRMQMKLAEDGDKTMLIWMGKQQLGQSDKNETALTGKDGGDIKTDNKWTISVVKPSDNTEKA